MIDIFKSNGYAVNPNDLRALTQQEILNIQISQLWATQNSSAQNMDYSAWANQPTDLRPLDERFADFKVRLAAAVERHKIPLAIPSQITPDPVSS